MKQEHLVSFFLPSLAGGGAERSALYLIKGFVEKGIKVDLLLNSSGGPYLSQVPSQVRILELKSSNILLKVLFLASYLRREQPQVLLSFLDNVNAAGWAKHFTFTRAKTKIIVSVRNNLSIELPSRFKFGGKFKVYFLSLAYPLADMIVAISQGVAKDLSKISNIPIGNIRVIYNPVFTPNLLERAKEPVSHPWFASGEPPIILGVGRLSEQKDFPALIQAFALVRQHRKIRLMILGEGEKRAELEALVRELGLENEVALPGFVENPYAYMAKANLFVLSSAWEGFGNVLVEAMATGTPVVSTDCPSGPAEILAGGEYGTLVPVGDVKALANTIVATLENPIEAGILQQRAQVFSVYTSVERYLELVNKIGAMH